MSELGILSIPAEQYHAADGISKSMLDWITPDMPGRKRKLDGGSPAHFRARFLAGEIEDEQTDAMRIGSITHRAILEPDTVEGAYHVKPDKMSFATTEGKAWRAEHADRPVISTPESVAVVAMRDAVWRHPTAKRVLKGAQTERSLFAEDSEGTVRKGRLDAILPSNGIADLKTCLCASEGDIEAAIWDRRYYVQGAWYLALCELCGIPKESFVLIFVEKSPPYDVVCVELDEDALKAGTITMEHDLRIYRECLASNKWPGRENNLRSVSIPEWARKQMEQV